MTEANKTQLARISKPATAVAGAVGQADALAALNNIVEAGREYLQLREEETTKRARLEAYRTVETERVRAAERVLTDYFDRVFAERSDSFQQMWSRLDEAAEKGDDDTVRNMLGGIVQLAQSSPLSGLADLPALRAAFDDPNTVWDL